MSRTTAIILTIAAAVLCGCPGLGLICFAALGGIGTQMPPPNYEPTASPQELALAISLLLCFGATLVLIPIIVGFFSFRLARADELSKVDMSEPLPPAN